LRVRRRAGTRLWVGEPLAHRRVFSKLGNSNGVTLHSARHSTRTSTVANIAARIAIRVGELPVRVVGRRVPRWLCEAALIAKWLVESWSRAESAAISGSTGKSRRLVGFLDLLVLASVITARTTVCVHCSRADATRSLNTKSWASE